MAFELRYTTHTLQFKFDARTSRGAISTHQVHYLHLRHTSQPGITGIGECAPLAGLSIDYGPGLEKKIAEVCALLTGKYPDTPQNPVELAALDLEAWPALRFALETAFLDWQQGGKRILYHNTFSSGEAGIPINGLIWMGDKTFMQEQIRKKLNEGYTCLKLKIGSLDFGSELELLQQIREAAGPEELTIRVDANGAFTVQDAYKKLEKLSRYALHSIEQPIRQGQPEEMAQLCAYTPVPIALDEELIGVQKTSHKTALLELIKPQYIILKPTLLGGLKASAEWIELAESRSINWWMTSALESNIGLNAISQFAANYPLTLPQGLGTGQLYHNNIASPLHIRAGELWYAPQQVWESIEQP